jgi:Ribose/xylose/arabinose/galactoside ABC-type transport systems, permease components
VTTALAAPARTYRDHGRPLWRRILLTHEMAIIGLLVLVYLAASLTVKGFAGPLTIQYLLPDLAAVLLIALPMTLVIVTGEIDLSVASTAGLAGVAFGIAHASGWPIGVALVLALLVGVVAGAVNGFFITVVGLPSLAVTIGTLALFRGLAVGLIGTDRVGGFPPELRSLALDRIPGTPIPNIIVVFAVLAIAFAVVLHFTPVGRSIFAIGLSSEAARFSGVRIERTKFVLFVVSGLVSALAGIYYALKTNVSLAENTAGLELSVIAAVLLGGVSIFGGRGALHGVIAGVLLIGFIGSALRLAGLTSDVISIVTGVLLVASVVTTSFLARFRRRRVGPGGKKGSPRPVE